MNVLVERPEYRVEITDTGIFAVVAKGGFDEDTVAQFRADTEKHVFELAPLRYLNDATALEESTLSARWALARLVKERMHLVARSAVCGVSPRKRLIVNALLHAAGRRTARLFDTRAEAERFLLAD